MTKQFWLTAWLLCCLYPIAPVSLAQGDEGLGQTIQIYTRFHSFVGKPSWLLVIRDLDHDNNIPYLFDIKKGDNFWVVFTYSRNYLISASNLQIETYRSRYNEYRNYRISNFCHLESQGRIIHGESIYLTVSGDLSPYTDNYSCHASRYADSNFPIATGSSNGSD